MNIISEMIWRADSIIADITGKNANVFYELGYSHAIGKNTILIAQCPEDVPFDRRSSIFELDCSGNRLESLSETIGELETCVH